MAAARPRVSLLPLQISALIKEDRSCHPRQKNSFLWPLFRHNGQLLGTHKGFLISLGWVCHCQTYILSLRSPQIYRSIDKSIDRFYRLINVGPRARMTAGNDIDHYPILTILFEVYQEDYMYRYTENYLTKVKRNFYYILYYIYVHITIILYYLNTLD